AAHAWYRRLASRVARREIVHYRAPEALLVIEDIMGNGELFGDALGVMNVLAGTTGALLFQRPAVVIELQRDTDDVIAFALQKPGNDRRIHAARHRRDDARLARRLSDSKTV